MVKLEAITAPDGSIEEEARLRTNVDAIVANMLAANVAQKIFETDERIGKEYWESPANHLLAQELTRKSAQAHDVGYGLGVPALG